MTEHKPEQPGPEQTTSEPNPPTARRNAPLLLAGGAAVLLLMVVCVLGGYLWGNRDQTQTQRDLERANADLTAVRDAMAPMQSDLQNTKSTLDSVDRSLQGCQDANRVLLVQVARRSALIPQF